MNGNSGYLTSTNQAYNIKRARRKLSTKSEVDCLDGMAIKGHKMSIAEQLKDTYSRNKNKNQLFENYHYPLINVISKRKVLNNSSKLVKNLLKYNNKVLMKRDEHLMLSKSTISKEKIDGYSTPKTKQRMNSTFNASLYSFASLQREDYLRKCRIKDYMRTHDCNFFNKEYFIKDPFDNYSRNAYKVKNIYQENDFINKIKRDVSGLKFSNQLKAYPDI